MTDLNAANAMPEELKVQHLVANVWDFYTRGDRPGAISALIKIPLPSAMELIRVERLAALVDALPTTGGSLVTWEDLSESAEKTILRIEQNKGKRDFL